MSGIKLNPASGDEAHHAAGAASRLTEQGEARSALAEAVGEAYSP